MVNSKDYLSKVGICFSNFEINKKNCSQQHIEISFYDSKGCFMKKEILLSFEEAYRISEDDIDSKDPFIWIVAKSKTPNLQIFTFQTNKYSNFSSGEHSF